MKLNNKGFAISTVMYMILILAVILITLTLSILSARKLVLDKIRKETANNIYNVHDISYRQALEIIKGEAISYANNNITKQSIKISDLNSSVDQEILDDYKLSDKYLTLQQNNGIYDVYLGKSVKITDIDGDINPFIDIIDYKIYGNTIFKNLPEQYQEVDYVTIQNDEINGYNNNIDTLIKFKNADKLEFKFKSTDSKDEMMLVKGGPYLSVRAHNVGLFTNGFTSRTITPSSLSRNDASDGTIRTISLEYTYSGNGNILFGSWSDSTWSRTIDWYSFKIWNGNTLLRNLFPCYRKSDNAIGFYDVVDDSFYINTSTGTFNRGEDRISNSIEKLYIESSGDLIMDSNDLNYGKYVIQVMFLENGEDEIVNIYLDEPLRCVGEVCDYIDFKNQKVHRNIGEYIVDGTENWNKINDSNTYYVEDLIPAKFQNNITVLTNYFNGITSGNDSAGNNGESWVSSTSSQKRYYIKTNKYNDLNSFKTWLSEIYASNKPLKLYYILNNFTEQNIVLSNVTDINNYDDIDIITTNKPSSVEFTVIEKIRQI